jgi:pimeloyl-ACP methyl ester carboxylesterase/DNA-binding winged helix-turn-helix (wHTH) protein
LLFRFESCVLDTGRRELRRGPELVDVEPQVFDLLTFLIENRERVVSRDDLIASVWGGRIVSDSTLSTRINAARKAICDNGDEQRLIRTMARKGFRFAGDVSEAATSADPVAAAAPAPGPQQEVHVCTASDGVRIAYALAGHGPPLIKAANWLNHLEYDWQSPVWSPLLHALAADHQLVRYDERGNGLSDWDVDDISFDAFVRDLESVVEATGLKRFALLGLSQGCAVSVAYAIRHPERVSHLVLHGGYGRGRRKRGSVQENEQADALVTLMRQGWGKENPAFRHVFTSLFIPGASGEQARWFDELQRVTTSPDNAVRIREAMNNIDVSELLPQVRTPTLVLHCRDDAVVPFDEGRRLAAGIPGARFVALDGQNHVVLEGDPSWSRFLEEIRSFLRQQ